MTKKKHEGKSPYAKYGKRPHKYSDHLASWTAAVKAGDKAAMERADHRWRSVYAPHTLECREGEFVI